MPGSVGQSTALAGDRPTRSDRALGGTSLKQGETAGTLGPDIGRGVGKAQVSLADLPFVDSCAE